MKDVQVAKIDSDVKPLGWIEFAFSGQLRSITRGEIWTNFEFFTGHKGSMLTGQVAEYFAPGNTVHLYFRGYTNSSIITTGLLKTMPTYKLTNEAGTVTIQTPDGKTLATIPADQAKTFADVEAAIWEQNKGKGNGEECIEATNYFLIHGIKPK